MARRSVYVYPKTEKERKNVWLQTGSVGFEGHYQQKDQEWGRKTDDIRVKNEQNEWRFFGELPARWFLLRLTHHHSALTPSQECYLTTAKRYSARLDTIQSPPSYNPLPQQKLYSYIPVSYCIVTRSSEVVKLLLPSGYTQR